MKILIITGTPKKDGLSCDCVAAAERGARAGGAEVEVARVCGMGIGHCRVCGDGWGTCEGKHSCSFGQDGFTELQQKIRDCDALIAQSPVYWGEQSETLKSFFDRLRRCEAPRHEGGCMYNKPAVIIAAPGGSGKKGLTCLDQMEGVMNHLHAAMFDYFYVNRWNADYKIAAIEACAKALAGGRLPEIEARTVGVV